MPSCPPPGLRLDVLDVVELLDDYPPARPFVDNVRRAIAWRVTSERVRERRSETAADVEQLRSSIRAGLTDGVAASFHDVDELTRLLLQERAYAATLHGIGSGHHFPKVAELIRTVPRAELHAWMLEHRPETPDCLALRAMAWLGADVFDSHYRDRFVAPSTVLTVEQAHEPIDPTKALDAIIPSRTYGVRERNRRRRAGTESLAIAFPGIEYDAPAAERVNEVRAAQRQHALDTTQNEPVPPGTQLANIW